MCRSGGHRRHVPVGVPLRVICGNGCAAVAGITPCTTGACPVSFVSVTVPVPARRRDGVQVSPSRAGRALDEPRTSRCRSPRPAPLTQCPPRCHRGGPPPCLVCAHPACASPPVPSAHVGPLNKAALCAGTRSHRSAGVARTTRDGRYGVVGSGYSRRSSDSAAFLKMHQCGTDPPQPFSNGRVARVGARCDLLLAFEKRAGHGGNIW